MYTDTTSSSVVLPMDIETGHRKEESGVEKTQFSQIEPKSSVPKNVNVGNTANAGKLSRKKKIARPMNSFMVFAQEYRVQLRTTNPEIDNKEISKMLGQKWKNLSDLEKKKYVNEAERLAEKHKIDHPDWKFVRAPPRKKPKAVAITLKKEEGSTSGSSCRSNNSTIPNVGSPYSTSSLPSQTTDTSQSVSGENSTDYLVQSTLDVQNFQFPGAGASAHTHSQVDPGSISAAMAFLLRSSHGNIEHDNALASYIASGGLDATMAQSVYAQQSRSNGNSDIASASRQQHVLRLAHQQIQLQKLKMSMVLHAAAQEGPEFLQSFHGIDSHGFMPRSVGNNISSAIRGAPPGYVQPPPA